MSKAGRLLVTVLRSEAVAFVPTQITGLVGWWDASDAATRFQDAAGTTPAAANDDPVGLWKDKSSGGKNASQATAGARPTYKSAGLNSLPALSFDGGDVLTFASLALTNYTIFIVYSVTTAALANYLLGNDAVAQGIYAGGTFAGIDGYGEIAGGQTREANAEPTATGITIWQNANLYRNGAEATYGDTGTLVGLTLTTLGGRKWTNLNHIGLISEILIYNSQFDAAKRALVNTYLAAKWGVTLS